MNILMKSNPQLGEPTLMKCNFLVSLTGKLLAAWFHYIVVLSDVGKTTICKVFDFHISNSNKKKRTREVLN